jgi:thioredoxin-like negative regulator of GroEL
MPFGEAVYWKRAVRNSEKPPEVGTLNELSNISIATRYEVRAVPALLAFNNGNLVDRKCGSLDASQIHAMLEPYLDNPARQE